MGILTDFQTKVNKKTRKKHKHFLDHEDHEERLKNKFIVRRKMATKRHKSHKGKLATESAESSKMIKHRLVVF